MTFNRCRSLFAVLAAIICTVVPVLAQISTAKVTGGIVEGVAKDGIASFKGVPFAAPPVGDLRWRSPQPVKPWAGVKKADEFAPGPMQDTAFGAMLGGPQKISEDCLYLNVWTGAKKANEKRPVMVWIYGGGFGIGMTSTPAYDGTSLAKKGVVLVSVAYRVGPMGFLAHPELSKESGKGSGAYGIQDQIAGLRWVKENIAKFGGDPKNVTIFGESAGGMAVGMLTTSPMAKGLFHRAISESGGAMTTLRSSLKEAEEQGKAYLSKLGANDIKAARALSAESIQKETKGMGSFRPVADGETIAEDQYGLFEAGKFNDTPILVGTNSDEGGLFVTQKITSAAFEKMVRDGRGSGAEAILKAYPHATDAEANRAAKDIMRESTFAWPTWTWAKMQSKHGKNKAFVYYFDHRTPTSPEGANHAAEIPYVFGNLGAMGGSNGPEDKALSELISSYWINFAKKGDPNGPGLPVWPAFDEQEQKTMFFDKTPGARPHPNQDKIKAFDAYFAKLREEAGKTTLLTAAKPGCTRASLQKIADKYLDALKKGTPSKMPLASGAKYIERRKEIPFGQGIWQAPLAVDFSRSLLDADICETYTEIISAKSSHPYVIGTRLKVVKNKIAEVESLVSNENDWLFDANNYLKYSSTEKWDILPPERRTDRQTLVKVASDYFDIFQDYSAFPKVPWGIPCVRIEGGAYTNPNNDPKPSCTVGVPKGGGVPMTNRRYIVDVDMGTVVGQIDFGGEKGLPDAHTFRLEDGKLRYVHVITLCPNGCPKIPMPKDMPK